MSWPDFPDDVDPETLIPELIRRFGAIYRRHFRAICRRLMLRRLMEAQNHRCCYCGRRFSDDPASPQRATREHVIPKAQGGVGEWSNLVAACLDCNRKRGHQDALAFYRGIAGHAAGMGGYLSSNVYDGKRPMATVDAANRRKGMKARLAMLKQREEERIAQDAAIRAALEMHPRRLGGRRRSNVVQAMVKDEFKSPVPRIVSLATGPANVLIVRWHNGVTARIDLSTWINAGGDALARLRRPEVFATAALIDHGWAVQWDGDDDLVIDTAHLERLAEQR